jgi:hypothetical protein
MHKTKCPECAQTLNLPDTIIGKRARCSSCRHTFVVQPPAARSPSSDREVEMQSEEEPLLLANHDDGVDSNHPPRVRKKKRKKAKEAAPPAGMARYYIAGGVLGFLLLCGLIVGGAVWLLSGAARDSGGAEAPLLAREPSAGSPTSWVPPVALASADPAAWQVKPDTVDPPAGLPSAFPVPGPGKAEWFTFATQVARAAVVMLRDPGGGDTFDLLHYDLRKGGPPSQSRLSDGRTPEDRKVVHNDIHYAAVCALSPSGARLAIRTGRKPFVGVWSTDGKFVRSLNASVGLRGEPLTTWIGFSDDDHLWVLSGTELTRREVASDKAIVTLPEKITASPVLTPGGKWLITSPTEGLVIYQATDGKRAAAIPLPSGWGAPAGTTTLAVHPSGREIAVKLTNKREDMLLAIWDLATGQLTDALHHTYHVAQKKMTGRLLWAGNRRLLCNNVLFDLELHTPLCSSVNLPGTAPVEGPATPDGRVWCIRGLTDPEWARAGEKLAPLAGTPPTRVFLTAASLPEAIAARLDEARKGFLWHPGVSLRVVSTNSPPPKYRSALKESLAADLAREGYRIDPNAPFTVEIDLKLGIKTTTGFGKQVPTENLSAAMREELRRKPGHAWYELTDVYNVDMHARVLHEDRLAIQPKPLMDFVGIKKKAKVDDAWESFTNRGFKMLFPPMLLRNAANKRLHLPTAVTLGVDGVLPADVKEVPVGTKDGFELPDDG